MHACHSPTDNSASAAEELNRFFFYLRNNRDQHYWHFQSVSDTSQCSCLSQISHSCAGAQAEQHQHSKWRQASGTNPHHYWVFCETGAKTHQKHPPSWSQPRPVCLQSQQVHRWDNYHSPHMPQPERDICENAFYWLQLRIQHNNAQYFSVQTH